MTLLARVVCYVHAACLFDSTRSATCTADSSSQTQGWVQPEENDAIRVGLDHSPINQQLETQSSVARGNICNDKTSLKPPPGKDEIENRSNYENLLAVYLRKHMIYGCLLSHR